MHCSAKMPHFYGIKKKKSRFTGEAASQIL
jgi:hypothetical protein